MANSAMGTAFRHLRDLFAAGSVVGLEDGQLLARYSRSNDPAAFEALVSRHGPMVLATCRAVLRNEHDVEDAFQATFLVLARKAGSVRGWEVLGGWLHRVAYRASVQTSIEARRRRRKEAEAAMARRNDSPRPESELAAMLHEEIDRLPGPLRLAVVLCDLEGLTYEEAARQLGWTLPRLRHRLSDGRQKLKGRLARRGALPLAIGAALASKAPAAVSPALARAVIAAATGGSPPAGAALLAHIILKGMLMTKLKIAGTAALAALALASAGVFTYAGQPADDPKPATEAKAGAVSKPELGVEDPAGQVEVRGLVVNPAGKPVAGAKVRASTREPVHETTTGPDGRFRLRVLPPDPWVSNAEYGGYPRVAAWAPGFGLGWIKNGLEPGPSGESTIRLVEDGPPIEGKIVDIEGRPVAGARVLVKIAWVVNRVSFDEWAARAKAQVANSLQGTLFGLWTSIEVETGPDGLFHLTGIGRDRVATLLITGPTIATTEVQVIVYDGPKIRSTPAADPSRLVGLPPKTEVFQTRKLVAVAGPTRPIEGVVRDKDTGRGIEGMPLRAIVFNQPSDGNIAASTDAEGRYRLLGLPAAPSYEVIFEQFPRQVLPYVNSRIKTPADPSASGPIRLDIALKRGIMVRGRVTDKATGRPVLGDVQAYVFGDNPHLAEFPHYEATRKTKNRTDEDGRFQVVTPPGRVVLSFWADRDEYVNALGAEAIVGYDPRRGLISPRGPLLVIHTHVLAGVDLDPKAESATVDLQVDSGRSVDLAVVDSDGRPVDGLKVQGEPCPIAVPPSPASSPVKVRALHPSRPRRVIVYQDERKLVGSIWLKGDEVGPLTVRLVRWGSVFGRFLDAEGNPLAARQVGGIRNTSPTKAEDEGILRMTTYDSIPTTDKDGRFRLEGLVPGLKYSISLGAFRDLPGSQNVVVAPGEVKDLGDIKSPLPRKQED